MTSVQERRPALPEPPGSDRPAGLGLVGWARWTWRQLTSMRTALLLLMLLAVLAVPGSLFPQRNIDQVAVAQYFQDNPDSAPWLDRLSLFDVYSSPWFSAVYLLLFISLVGCVLPRTKVHVANLRQAPPRTPARLSRLPEHRTVEVDAAPGDVLRVAQDVLRSRRYRTADFGDDRHGPSMAGQRGELRESGNLLFHLALVGVLIAVGIGGLYGYRAQVIVQQGQAYTNQVTAYDSWDPGAYVDGSALPPFSFALNALRVAFDEDSSGNQFGAPRSFEADVTVTDAPGQAPRQEKIRVNEPLRAGGASVYLAGNGYAPVITVRNGAGEVVFDQGTPFLVQDANYTSTGVVKVSDPAGDLGLQGLLLPTASEDSSGPPVSTFPDLRNPEVLFFAYTGDLGLDDGVPQNVYELDTSRMQRVTDVDGQPLRFSMKPGDTYDLPNGLGSVTLDRIDRFAGFTVRHDPARAMALTFSLLAIVGLTASLFVPRRRVWVRAAPATGDAAQGRTLLEVGALARSEDHGLAGEADAVLSAVLARLPARDTDQTPSDKPPRQEEP
ncbi:MULTISPECIES: cytochrome c biogenesis protein ResB [Actinomycetes]|uniref:Cytochrome c biogenesis protein ResB n=1 Tax=Quadrisphaera setariae TaxID=2593304 RepID=A0A5C8Z5L3_9ACTN|nr:MULTISPECIES: cytochrome c biogenesis protein ResB [Actinomycetes]TNM60436.1 cytochrome c biogenesis protein ResB [Streptomyces sp. NP160]TXR52421.1 cytochrome c biogenesis protein ResB [Quadrisphaera setariae]